MESKYTPFTGGVSPVAGETKVQLKLSNGNEPIDLAEIFHWSKVGRGVEYPHILGWREATQEEYDEYQARKAAFP
jgi:hypothetical protein